MRTKNIFKVLALYMIGFGVLIGIVFPYFIMLITQIPAQQLLTPIFAASCIVAGFLVGLFNIFLAKMIVGRKISEISRHMKHVEQLLLARQGKEGLYDDALVRGECLAKVDSDDEIGESAKAFNAMVRALSSALSAERNIKAFTEMLTSELDLNQLAFEALNRLMEYANASAGAFVIEKEGELEILCTYGIADPAGIVKSDVVWKVLKDQKGIVVNLPADLLLKSALVEFRPRYLMIEPIVYKGVALGFFVLAGIEAIAAGTREYMALLGGSLALALKNAINHDQLQRLAANDPLTGVFNRRFGLSRLKDEFSRSVRTNQPMGVVLLDIDHFKAINDTYGHFAGDRTLVTVTKLIKGVLREGDVLIRYGGEEFVIIFLGASIADVRSISERLRRVIEESELLFEEQRIKITVSIGGTSYPERNVDDALQLISIADGKLYHAKNGGRNRVVIE